MYVRMYRGQARHYLTKKCKFATHQHPGSGGCRPPERGRQALSCAAARPQDVPSCYLQSKPSASNKGQLVVDDATNTKRAGYFTAHLATSVLAGLGGLDCCRGALLDCSLQKGPHVQPSTSNIAPGNITGSVTSTTTCNIKIHGRVGFDGGGGCELGTSAMQKRLATAGFGAHCLDVDNKNCAAQHP